MNLNQPCCERCWVLRELDGLPTSMGNFSKHVRTPVCVIGHEKHRCAFCGFPTWVGAFVREHPDKVLYPAEDDDE